MPDGENELCYMHDLKSRAWLSGHTLAAEQGLDSKPWARILVQVTIYRRLLIGRDGHLDQSEAYDIS